MKASPVPDSEALAPNKEFEIQIPSEMKKGEKILGATFLQFQNCQCIPVYSENYLHFIEMEKGTAMRYFTFSIANITSIVSIVLGYMVITNRENKIWLLEVKKGDSKELESRNKRLNLHVQHYLKETLFNSYYLREVSPSMFQLQIYAQKPNSSTKNLLIYQFTPDIKLGVMGFTLDNNYHILKQTRKQTYSSKKFYDSSQALLVRLDNLDDDHFFTQSVRQGPPVHVFSDFMEDHYYGLTHDKELYSLENHDQPKKAMQELKQLNLTNSVSHLNYLLVEFDQNRVCLMCFEKGCELRTLGFEKNIFYWNITTNGRLVGIDHGQKMIKITRQQGKSAAFEHGADASTSKGTFQEVPQHGLHPASESTQQKVTATQKNPNKDNQTMTEIKKTVPNFKPSKIISRKNSQAIMKDKQAVKKAEEQKKRKEQSQEREEHLEGKTQLSDLKTSDGSMEDSSKKQDEQAKKPHILGTTSTLNQQRIQIQSQAPKSQQTKAREHTLTPKLIQEGGETKVSPFQQMKIPNVPYSRIFGKPAERESVGAPQDPYSIFPSPFTKKPSIDSVESKKQESKVLPATPSQKQQSACPKEEKKEQCVGTKFIRVQQESEQTIKLFQDKIHSSVENFSDELAKLHKETECVSNSLSERLQALPGRIVDIIPQTKLLDTAVSAKMTEEIKERTEQSLNRYFSENLTGKMNSYFEGIAMESKGLYDASLNFYENRKKNSIISLQYHFQEQEKLISEIRLISSNMLTCVQTTVSEGEELHGCLEHKWNSLTKNFDEKLEGNHMMLEKIEGNQALQRKQDSLMMESIIEIKEQLKQHKAERKERQKKKEEEQQERTILKEKEAKMRRDAHRDGKKHAKKNKGKEGHAQQIWVDEEGQGRRRREVRRGEDRRMPVPQYYERFYSNY